MDHWHPVPAEPRCRSSPGASPGIRSSKTPPPLSSGRAKGCRGANGSKSSGSFGASREDAAGPQADDDAATPAAGGNRSAKGSLSALGASARCGAGVTSERQGTAGVGFAPGPSRSANGSLLDAGGAKSANGPPRSAGAALPRGVGGEVRDGVGTLASTVARPRVIVEASSPPSSSSHFQQVAADADLVAMRERARLAPPQRLAAYRDRVRTADIADRVARARRPDLGLPPRNVSLGVGQSASVLSS